MGNREVIVIWNSIDCLYSKMIECLFCPQDDGDVSTLSISLGQKYCTVFIAYNIDLNKRISPCFKKSNMIMGQYWYTLWLGT
jgi:hypothetical protein